MSDTLNGQNIELFLMPIDIDKNTLSIKYLPTNRKFEFNKKLPVKNYGYDYSEDFVIFDYEANGKTVDKSWVYVVERGKCLCYVPPSSLKKYPILLVLNKYGIPLKVNYWSDFTKLQKDFDELKQNILAIEQKKIKNAQYKIEALEKQFQQDWYDLSLLSEINSNIVGIILTILALNPEFDAKTIFPQYCKKHNLNKNQEIAEYYEWQKLHGIGLSMEDITDVLI
jgi:hypothetical protein